MRYGLTLLLVSGLAAEPMPPPPEPDRPLLTTLRATGSFLGVGVAEITADRAKALGLREEHGVEVTRVAEESPAAVGGIKTGDVVLEYNGQRVEGVAQFMRLVQETPAGREVKLTIARAGSSQTVAVKTAPRKVWTAQVGETIELPRIELPELRMPEVPRAMMSWRSTVAGIEAESLDTQLAEFFGVKEGVLVRAVVKGSPADKAGLRAGDVIVKIDDARVTSPREISSSIRAARAKKTVPVQIVRERREMSVTLPMEEAEGPSAMPRRSLRR